MRVVEEPMTRRDLAQRFAEWGCETGAEIGVETGEYSEVLCAANPALHLWCIDAWLAYPGYREHVTQAKLDGFYEHAKRRLAPYRVSLLRATSLDAASSMPNRSLDFVYLDANHTLPHVIADLAAWVPKVKQGGIVAGHDWGRRSVGHVKEAVTAWAEAYGIPDVHLCAKDRSPSWYWAQA